MSYEHAFNIIGLVMNLGGVTLLLVFGLPFCVRKSIIIEQPDPKAVRAECWYDVFGWLGLALIVLGTGAQIKAMVL